MGLCRVMAQSFFLFTNRKSKEQRQVPENVIEKAQNPNEYMCTTVLLACLRSKLVKDFLKKNVKTLDWPASSPDLN